MTHEEANAQGFRSIEEKFELEGAWSIGWCCFDHMVRHLDNGPTNRPIVRDEDCYNRERRTQSDAQERYREKARPPRVQHVQPIPERAPASTFMRRRLHQKENQPLPEKTPHGLDFERAIRKHQKLRRESFVLLESSGRPTPFRRISS